MKISKSEFARRRKKLMGMMDRNSIAIVPGAREVTRSRDTEYPFRQNSDLFYLTGFEEPDAVLVLIPGRRQGQVILFCRERDPEMELWNGYRVGPEGAVAYLGVDDAFPVDDLDEILPGLIEGTQRIYYSMGHDDVFDQRVMGWVNQIRRLVRTGAAPPADFTDLAFLLHEHRLIKSAAEIRVMRRAGGKSVQRRMPVLCVSASLGVMNTTLRRRFSILLPSMARVFPPTAPLSARALTPAYCTTPRTTRDCARVILF